MDDEHVIHSRAFGSSHQCRQFLAMQNLEKFHKTQNKSSDGNSQMRSPPFYRKGREGSSGAVHMLGKIGWQYFLNSSIIQE